ncbi:alpha-glucuronidase family glycosyl hydrolase [Micromonospora chokoriensis]|uniref:alpha-glucuronidase family glycosyl hydrolase n=1 Tax=Micromonospora chokoriensis TaxID=356851 RepID=UPI000AE2C97E|nr:alpha-glucuronidase family glycosyl hydrolase [Micromonospora chokoriensis]
MNRASVPRLRRTLIVLGTALATVAATLTVATTPVAAAPSPDDYSGSDLWLRYVPVDDAKLLRDYRRAATAIVVENADATKVHRHTTGLAMAPGSTEKLVETTLGGARDELVRGLGGLLGQPTPVVTVDGDQVPDGAVVVGTPTSSPLVGRVIPARDLAKAGDEGYLVRSVSKGRARFTVIAGNTDLGALYGTYAFLRLLQTQKPIDHLRVAESPKIKHRLLNNWETERLYAGNNASGLGGLNGESGAVFNFAATGASAGRNLPVILDRYLVMARALASLGINGITINNVNADNAYLTSARIAQEAALADALRPYGIRLGLSIRYPHPPTAGSHRTR